MFMAGITLCIASAIHFGLPIPLGVLTIHDPFAGAAIPELILGVIMLGGGAFATRNGASSWPVALACTGFTLLLTLYGTSITVASADWGDVVYHAALLTLLGTILGLLITKRRAQVARSTLPG
jgi:hypothetical protein